MKHELSASKKAKSLSLDISLDIYTLDAIKKACYKFSDRSSIFLSEIDQDSNVVSIIFTFPEPTPIDENVLYEFKNELIDQDLRQRISSETEAIRNLILAQAFSKTSLLDE
ncbi:MAG: His-Xaa-Ser system protein HxsD [Candidatus Dadabacteria bacterium]